MIPTADICTVAAPLRQGGSAHIPVVSGLDGDGWGAPSIGRKDCETHKLAELALYAVESTSESPYSRAREDLSGSVAGDFLVGAPQSARSWNTGAAELDGPLLTSTTPETAWGLSALSARGTTFFVFADAPADAFLSEALEEWEDLDAYAAECDFPPPAPAAKRTALALLEKIVRAVPRYYALSPWDNGEVIMHSSGRPGHRVSIRCGAKGEASCLVIHPTRKTEQWFARTPLELPMDKLAAALRELDAAPA